MIFVLCPYGIDAGLVSKAVSLGNGDPVHILVPAYDLAEAQNYGAAVIHTLSSAGAYHDKRGFFGYPTD